MTIDAGSMIINKESKPNKIKTIMNTDMSQLPLIVIVVTGHWEGFNDICLCLVRSPRKDAGSWFCGCNLTNPCSKCQKSINISLAKKIFRGTGPFWIMSSQHHFGVLHIYIYLGFVIPEYSYRLSFVAEATANWTPIVSEEANRLDWNICLWMFRSPRKDAGF